MRLTPATPFLVLLLTLAGCHSTPDSARDNAPLPEHRQPTAAVMPASPDDPADAPVAEDRRPRLVCFGDSITAGYNLDPGQSYPDDLQRLLARNGYNYRVVNEGISGNTSKDALARVGRIIALKPALVIVEFGGNDGLRGIPVADTRANLNNVLSRLQAAGIPFALAGMTLPPSYGAVYVQQFNETYTLLAQRYKAPLLPFLYQGIYGQPGMIQPDGIHPTAQGSVRVADNILRLIQPLLKK